MDTGKEKGNLILIEIPEETREYIAKIRGKYGFRPGRLSPHITMVPPFEVPYSREDLMQRLGDIEYVPFRVDIDGFMYLEGRRNNVISLNINENHYLLSLYVKLRNLLEADAYRIFGRGSLFRTKFSYHITVNKGLTPKEIKRYKKDFDKEQYEISWMVNSFWLYSWEGPENGWVPFKEYRLRGKT